MVLSEASSSVSQEETVLHIVLPAQLAASMNGYRPETGSGVEMDLGAAAMSVEIPSSQETPDPQAMHKGDLPNESVSRTPSG